MPRIQTHSKSLTMATRVLIRNLLSSVNQTLTRRTFTTSVYLQRFRPISAIAASKFRHSSLPTHSRAFSSHQNPSSPNDSNPNGSDWPPEWLKSLQLPGCDMEHWVVVMEKPEGEPTRDEIIESYINTLAQVVGSPDEARMKIYSVSTRFYYAFGALVSEELAIKISMLPGVIHCLGDFYVDVANKQYGGEPFINGKAVPYDPKYHERYYRDECRDLGYDLNFFLKGE